MTNSEKGPFPVSGQPPKTPHLTRGDLLRVGGVVVGGIVGAELLRRNMPIVWGALMAELADPNKVDTTGDGLGDTSGFNSEELLDIRINPLAYDRQLEAEQKALRAERSEQRIADFNLWETVNLNNEQYPVAIIVVPKQGDIMVSSLAFPVGLTDDTARQFDNASSRRILSYIPWGKPEYDAHPFTWAHSGAINGHKLFAGKWEIALNQGSKGKPMSTEEIITNAREQFADAKVLFLQGQTDEVFRDISWAKLDKAIEKFAGNVLELRVSAGIRIPRAPLVEFRGNLADPYAWLSDRQDELNGWGWDVTPNGSQWNLLFCARSSTDEAEAHGGRFELTEGWWGWGFELVDRRKNFDPFP